MSFRHMVISILLGLGILMSSSDRGLAAPKPLSVEDIEGLLRHGVMNRSIANVNMMRSQGGWFRWERFR